MNKAGWGFLVLVCGCLTIAGVQATFATGNLQNLILAIVFVLLTWVCIEKARGRWVPMKINWGWALPTCFLGILVVACFNAFFRDFSTKQGDATANLLLGIICIPLTVLCTWKLLKTGLRILPETRKYNPNDPLPVATCPGLLLSNGEVCHICENIKIGKVKNLSVGSVSSRSGGSVRIARGLSVHSGTSRSKTIRADVLDVSSGMLYVTNKRVVASSPKYSFNEQLSSIVTVNLYSDGFALQFGRKNYTIIVRDPTYVATILQVAAQTGN